MNFEHMPELQWEYGYQFSLFLMAMVGVSMVSYFWRKKWL
jgi:magnesium transporter